MTKQTCSASESLIRNAVPTGTSPKYSSMISSVTPSFKPGYFFSMRLKASEAAEYCGQRGPMLEEQGQMTQSTVSFSTGEKPSVLHVTDSVFLKLSNSAARASCVSPTICRWSDEKQRLPSARGVSGPLAGACGFPAVAAAALAAAAAGWGCARKGCFTPALSLPGSARDLGRGRTAGFCGDLLGAGPVLAESGGFCSGLLGKGAAAGRGFAGEMARCAGARTGAGAAASSSSASSTSSYSTTTTSS
mmetsp:Transcript_14469/g.56896  ORF Transcript_14469/g.56896 Transcript_14469/m.56896 type:complete len:247 (-) Transcript_14469:293-1033(-)